MSAVGAFDGTAEFGRAEGKDQAVAGDNGWAPPATSSRTDHSGAAVIESLPADAEITAATGHVTAATIEIHPGSLRSRLNSTPVRAGRPEPGGFPLRICFSTLGLKVTNHSIDRQFPPPTRVIVSWRVCGTISPWIGACRVMIGTSPRASKCFLCDDISGRLVWREKGYEGLLCRCGMVYTNRHGVDALVDPTIEHHERPSTRCQLS